MSTQEAKAHHVGEWASLRNTSPEIAEAIFDDLYEELILSATFDAFVQLAAASLM